MPDETILHEDAVRAVVEDELTTHPAGGAAPTILAVYPFGSDPFQHVVFVDAAAFSNFGGGTIFLQEVTVQANTTMSMEIDVASGPPMATFGTSATLTVQRVRDETGTVVTGNPGGGPSADTGTTGPVTLGTTLVFDGGGNDTVDVDFTDLETVKFLTAGTFRVLLRVNV